MYTCEICNQKFKSLKSVSIHIGKHNITKQNYYDKFIKKEDEGNCLFCGKKTSFKSLILGYSKFCSCKCSMNYNSKKIDYKKRNEKSKQTCLEKYGVDILILTI
jgi:hypothetical protein